MKEIPRQLSREFDNACLEQGRCRIHLGCRKVLDVVMVDPRALNAVAFFCSGEINGDILTKNDTHQT